ARGKRSGGTCGGGEPGAAECRWGGGENGGEAAPAAGPASAWRQAEALRKDGRAGHLKWAGTDRELYMGDLFFSRPCLDASLSEAQRKAKKYEYFVLVRDTEFDPAHAAFKTDPVQRLPKLDGSYLTTVRMSRIPGGHPAVGFSLTAKGGELFADLTRKNVPSRSPDGDEHKRHLAILLDGQVMTAPTLNSEIRDRGQIAGSFTEKEIEAMVNILRAGALPARLRPEPVSETTIGGAK